MPENPIVKSLTQAHRAAESAGTWSGLFKNPSPTREPPQLNKLGEGATRAIRSPVSEAHPRGSPGRKLHGSSSEPSAQVSLSPKSKQPVRKLGKPRSEGVPLIDFDSPDPEPARDGAFREGKQPPPGLKGQGMGQWQPDYGTPPPVVQKPRSEGVPLIDADFPNLKPPPPPKPPAYSIPHGSKQPPPPKLPKERDTGQGQGQGHHRTLPVARKPDNEGVPLIDFNPPGLHHLAQDSISHESKHAPPLLPPPPRPPKEREEQGHETPPVVRKPDVKDIPLMSPNPADPRPPVQGGAQHEGRQTPRQCAVREQGRSGTPTATRNHESESGASNLDSVDPQLQVKDSAFRKDEQFSTQARGRGRRGRGGGGGGGGRFKKDQINQNHDNEGGAPVDTDPPDPQSPVPDGALRDTRNLSGQGGRSSTRGRGGRSTSNQERAVDRKQENEVVRRDSSDSTIPKDSKSKGDSSQPKDGVASKRSTMPPPPRRPTEPTQPSDEFTQLKSEFTKLSKEHARFSEESVQTTAQLGVRLVELDAIIAEKDNQILELTEAISRLHQRDVEITKDDNYFATQFSDIASSIMQWVLTHFPRDTTLDYEVSRLPSPLRQFIRMSIPSNDEHYFRSRDTRVRVISAVVAEILYRHVFYYGPYYLPGSPETSEALQVLSTKLQTNTLQCQRWRALTISLLSKGNNFESDFAEHVNVVTETLNNMLWVLVPPESDTDRREIGLRELVDRAARLSVEIRKQSDNIYLEPIVPGSPYNSKDMEDLSCLLEDDELVDATVQIQIFPAVLRRSCESDGTPSAQAGVVMKARVIAVNPLYDM